MLSLHEELDRRLASLSPQQRAAVGAFMRTHGQRAPLNATSGLLLGLVLEGVIDADDVARMLGECAASMPNLAAFELGSRNFGANWAQNHLLATVPTLQPGSKVFDPHYTGAYDACTFDPALVRIEVKASRGVKPSRHARTEVECDTQLALRALPIASNARFTMNFGQIKPGCADVFVLIAVWSDAEQYWVMTRAEVAAHRHFSPQHRATTVEGQLQMRRSNVHRFLGYAASACGLGDAIAAAAARSRVQPFNQAEWEVPDRSLAVHRE